MWRQPVPAPFCQSISNNGAQFVVNKEKQHQLDTRPIKVPCEP